MKPEALKFGAGHSATEIYNKLIRLILYKIQVIQSIVYYGGYSIEKKGIL